MPLLSLNERTISLNDGSDFSVTVIWESWLDERDFHRGMKDGSINLTRRTGGFYFPYFCFQPNQNVNQMYALVRSSDGMATSAERGLVDILARENARRLAARPAWYSDKPALFQFGLHSKSPVLGSELKSTKKKTGVDFNAYKHGGCF